MKIVDNPRRDINMPAIGEMRLAGVGGVRRSGPAELTVDAGPPGPDDGPVPSGTASPVISPRIFATPEVSVELGAVQQLARLARLDALTQAQSEALRRAGQSELAARYERVRVVDVVGTPDLHRGDAGVAIGTVLGVDGAVMPLGPGPDIGCGMRLITTDLTPADLDLPALAEGLRADLFLGRRDIALSRSQRLALLTEGLMGLFDAEDTRRGCGAAATSGSLWARFDRDETEWELDHCVDQGSLPGDPRGRGA